MIDKAESEHRDLLLVYVSELDVKEVIDCQSEKTFFSEAWDYLNERVLHLRQLCSGPVTAYSNTTSVESDFSTIKWERRLTQKIEKYFFDSHYACKAI